MNFTGKTHLDFTTLYGAASLFQTGKLAMPLTLSRLLCLSQFIESIVLHDKITYEIAHSKEWEKYTEVLLKSPLVKNVKKHGLPLYSIGQLDSDESILTEAIINVVDYMDNIPLLPLFWALHFRQGTYSSISGIKDRTNPVVKKYIKVAQSIDSPTFKSKFQKGIKRFIQNDVGGVGFGTLVRIELLQNGLISKGIANYYPHYARQTVIANFDSKEKSVIHWSLNNLKELRNKAMESINKPEDIMAKSLSPIFMACLDGAKRPEDIIENALVIRNSKEAKEYRGEIKKVLNSSFDEIEYRINLDKILNLDHLLNAKKDKIEYFRQWGISMKTIPLGYMWAGKRTLPRKDRVGDRTALFFSDILRQSLAFMDSSQKISEIFNTELYFDTSIISCAVPN